MQQIDNLSSEADQLVTFVLPDGNEMTLEFIYRPAIERWSVNLSHPNLTLNGVNLCVSANLLRQWRKIINFGLAVISTSGLDPTQVTDLSDGSCTIYVLSSDEATQVETAVIGAPA